nr:hypothetical protein BaRGS_011732 [Batillaria attramentaria]
MWDLITVGTPTALFGKDAETLKNKATMIRQPGVSHEVMQDGISGRIQKRRELQLILGAKKKVLQQERDMVEDEDSEAYFEHVQRLNACTDENTDPMWLVSICVLQMLVSTFDMTVRENKLEECKMLEEAQETKRRELKERLRTVQELQKTFDERVKNYSEKFDVFSIVACPAQP